MSKTNGCGKKAKFHNDHKKKGSASGEDEGHIIKFVYLGEKSHSRTPIFYKNLSLSDILKKIPLDISLPPPSAQSLFESYFKEDIFPYVRHNIQSQINNKRDIAKLWEVQKEQLQTVYIERAKLLKTEWLRLKEIHKNSKSKADIDEEAMKKKMDLKAKKKQKSQDWKEQIAMKIASGQFDDEPVLPSQHQRSVQIKSKKKKKEKKKMVKPSKPIKKKKLKKWKEKKVKTEPEWPSFGGAKPVNGTTDTNTNNNEKRQSVASLLKENLKRMEAEEQLSPLSQSRDVQKVKTDANDSCASNGKLIASELRFKVLLRSENGEHVICDENESESTKVFIDSLQNVNELVVIKIWIYMEIQQRIKDQFSQILLVTDREKVHLSLNDCALFELLWNDFGQEVKQRIDSSNIGVVFVKKSKTLRVKIPILSI